MTFSLVSVLVPTRGRLRNLERLLASYRATVGPHMAELVFRVDDDDAETIAFLQSTPWTVVVGPRLQGYRSLPQFFDEMAAAARGDVLMCANDDLTFDTPDWPSLVLATANLYPDGIFDLAVNTLNAGNVPFSIVSRYAVETMGHVHDPRVFWGDVYLRDVMAAFGRVIPLPEVRVSHHWQGHQPDQVFEDARQGEHRWDANYWALHQSAVQTAVARLRGVTC